MAQTTPTTTAARNGHVPAQLVPISCPAWCGGHCRRHSPGGDPLGTWVHESEPHLILVEEGTGRLIVCVYRVDEQTPHDTIISDTKISVVVDLVDYYAEHDLTFSEAHRLASALLDSVNLALPPSERTFIGPPGFEYVRDDCER